MQQLNWDPPSKIIYSDTITNFRTRARKDDRDEFDAKEIKITASVVPQSFKTEVHVGRSWSTERFSTSDDAILHAKHVKSEILRGVPFFSANGDTLPARSRLGITLSFAKDVVFNPVFWVGVCGGLVAAGLVGTSQPSTGLDNLPQALRR